MKISLLFMERRISSYNIPANILIDANYPAQCSLLLSNRRITIRLVILSDIGRMDCLFSSTILNWEKWYGKGIRS